MLNIYASIYINHNNLKNKLFSFKTNMNINEFELCVLFNDNNLKFKFFQYSSVYSIVLPLRSINR
jgi:hypothetical protein